MDKRAHMIIFIPIKEVSQRVPKKNFRNFCGAPLYKHVIRKFSDHRVYVDTDSDEIIKECNADPTLSHVTAFKRQKSLCGHKISVCDLIKSFINKFKINEPIAQIHVTSPFLSSQIVEDAYRLIGDYDSIVSCNRHQTRFWRKESYGFCPINHNPLKMQQTQDLPEIFEENSCFYIFNSNVVLETGNRIGKSPFFYVIEYPYNIDIDTEKDWLIATREKNES